MIRKHLDQEEQDLNPWRTKRTKLECWCWKLGRTQECGTIDWMLIHWGIMFQ